MKDVSGEGRTVLFVSHNMAAVKSLCTRGIMLENGKITSIGTTDKIVKSYFGGDRDSFNYRVLNYQKNNFFLNSVGVRNSDKGFDDEIIRDKEITFEFVFTLSENIDGLYFNVKFKDEEGKYIITTASNNSVFIDQDTKKINMNIPSGFFNEGNFNIELLVIQKKETGYEVFFHDADLLSFDILPEERPLGTWMGKEQGYIRHTFEWIK
jgi:lipopolysaccharide transport system ATP-binding protein